MRGKKGCLSVQIRYSPDVGPFSKREKVKRLGKKKVPEGLVKKERPALGGRDYTKGGQYEWETKFSKGGPQKNVGRRAAKETNT